MSFDPDEPSSWPQDEWGPDLFGLLLLAAIALILVVCIPGCTSAELNRVDPPVKEPACDGNNPYKCADGSCCDSSRPVCWGPDAVGFYCEAQEIDPMDPDVFGARPKHYAKRPVVQ